MIGLTHDKTIYTHDTIGLVHDRKGQERKNNVAGTVCIMRSKLKLINQ